MVEGNGSNGEEDGGGIVVALSAIADTLASHASTIRALMNAVATQREQIRELRREIEALKSAE